MLKKLILLLTFTAVSLFALNFQTASKAELMSIKGIGEKRAAAIMKYRKSNKIRSATDLEKVPGIGKEIAGNAKKGIKNTNKKTVSKKKSTTKSKAKSKTKKTQSKAKDKVKKKSKTKSKTKKTKKKAGDKTKRAEKKVKSKSKKKSKTKK